MWYDFIFIRQLYCFSSYNAPFELMKYLDVKNINPEVIEVFSEIWQFMGSKMHVTLILNVKKYKKYSVRTQFGWLLLGFKTCLLYGKSMQLVGHEVKLNYKII